MRRIAFAISAVGLAVSIYALPGRFADNSADLTSYILKGSFILLFLISFVINGICVIRYIKQNKKPSIRTIRQYYLQRSTR
ncbi:hypothetical protein ACFPVY_01005 [Flavobacterium qiangtangense]|uniref:Uncharacterized protein n=1 Tax=Flavobacterium qiangtangense TaxID=1442595 RepID=A0ABW1PJM0_9FLAO